MAQSQSMLLNLSVKPENLRKKMGDRWNKQIEKLTRAFKRGVLRDEFLLAHKAWKKAKGDQSLRFDYDLKKNSVVFDVGSYKGDFAAQIDQKFNAHIYLFEPSQDFYTTCQSRFNGADKIHIYNFGLADTNCEMYLSDDDDGASVFREQNQQSKKIKLRAIKEVLEELSITKIDLMKINIEGGEFPLMKEIIETGLVEHIDRFQIQFHNFIPNAKTMRDDIRSGLMKTHKETWNFPFVWESWERQ